MKSQKIAGTPEAWEEGPLGRELEYAEKVGLEEEQAVEESLQLKSISIRLPQALIEEFKSIAKYHDVGYQPLMRDALKRFAEHELKLIALQWLKEQEKTQTTSKEAKDHGHSIAA